MIIVYLIVIAVTLAIWYLVAKEFANIAEEKGFYESKYFWYTFLFGLYGMLMIIALPNKKINEKQQEILGELKNIKKSQSSSSQENAATSKPIVQNTTTVVPKESDFSAAEVKEISQKTSFTRTSHNTIICTKCNFEQLEGRKVCWRCGVKFYDEN